MRLKFLSFWAAVLLGVAALGYLLLGNKESMTSNAKDAYSFVEVIKTSTDTTEDNERSTKNETSALEQQVPSPEVDIKGFESKEDAALNLDKVQKNTFTSELRLNDIVSRENGKKIFDSQLVEDLSLSKTLELILELPDSMYDSESQDIMDNISQGLLGDVEEYNGMRLDATSCSDEICGIVISSYNKNDVVEFLDAMTSNPHIKDGLKGGSLKIIEENGEYYGVMIGVIGAEPITIK